MTTRVHRSRIFSAARALTALIMIALLSAPVAADEPHRGLNPGTSAPAATTATSPAADNDAGDDSELTCVKGCLRWGQHCNVDPRGVRRCQRRCEHFGDICE